MIKLEVKGRTLLVTLDRPKVRNAWNPELALGLQEISATSHDSHAAPIDAEAFLSAVYRYQE